MTIQVVECKQVLEGPAYPEVFFNQCGPNAHTRGGLPEKIGAFG